MQAVRGAGIFFIPDWDLLTFAQKMSQEYSKIWGEKTALKIDTKWCL